MPINIAYFKIFIQQTFPKLVNKNSIRQTSLNKKGKNYFKSCYFANSVVFSAFYQFIKNIRCRFLVTYPGLVVQNSKQVHGIVIVLLPYRTTVKHIGF